MAQNRFDKEDPIQFIFEASGDDHPRALFDRLSEKARVEVQSLQPVMNLLGAVAGEAEPPASLRQRLKVKAREDRNQLASRAPGQAEIVQNAELPWQPTPFEGISFKTLYMDRRDKRVTMLVRMNAGCVYPGHIHHGLEETLVVAGDIYTDGLSLTKGDYHRAESGSRHGDLFTNQGCVILLTTSIQNVAFSEQASLA